MIKFLYFFFSVIVRLLFGAWSAPKTWAAEPLTSGDLNQYVRDNQNSLKDRADNSSEYTLNEGADYTTSSGSFVDIDGTNLSLTITTQADSVVLIGFSGTVNNGNSGNKGPFFDISIDAVDEFGNDGLCMVEQANGLNSAFMFGGFVAMKEGLSAGSHTFKLRWKTQGGTLTLLAGAGGADIDVHPQFWVKEI